MRGGLPINAPPIPHGVDVVRGPTAGIYADVAVYELGNGEHQGCGSRHSAGLLARDHLRARSTCRGSTKFER